jgi:hypothetical protein
MILAGASVQTASAGNPGPFPLVAAGQTVMAVVNTNDNNSLNDPEDCKIMAEVDEDAVMTQSGTLTVTSVQNATEETSLQYCEETFSGPAFLSPGMGEMNLSRNPGDTQQSIITLLTGLSSPSSTPSALAGNAAGDGPFRLGAATLRSIFGTDRGEGVLCNAGGPAIQVRLDNGVKMIFNLQPFPDASNPTHMCARGVPLEVGFGEFDTHDVCIPVDANGNTPIALENAPDEPFMVILFSQLPACSLGREAAPTASELGLILLALALLGGGVWLLGRRQAFADSLPRL